MSEPVDESHGWVLLLAQLPAGLSSPRVSVWRRARTAGAVGLHNGVWVLPSGPANERFLAGLAEYVRGQGGTAFCLRAKAETLAEDTAIVARFRSDRAKEYTEFTERGADLIGELEKESARRNFSFAELEENEQVLDRLAGWLDKITDRDFFPDDDAKHAASLLERCRTALERFTAEVHRAEGVDSDIPGEL